MMHLIRSVRSKEKLTNHCPSLSWTSVSALKIFATASRRVSAFIASVSFLASISINTLGIIAIVTQ